MQIMLGGPDDRAPLASWWIHGRFLNVMYLCWFRSVSPNYRFVKCAIAWLRYRFETDILTLLFCFVFWFFPYSQHLGILLFAFFQLIVTIFSSLLFQECVCSGLPIRTSLDHCFLCFLADGNGDAQHVFDALPFCLVFKMSCWFYLCDSTPSVHLPLFIMYLV